jgi:hypothetical protein
MANEIDLITGNKITFTDSENVAGVDLDSLVKGEGSAHASRHNPGGADAMDIIPLSGWVEVSDTWAYASATTITVPAGAASKYQKGDKIRLKQSAGTYKYFYIITVTDTLLTITGGSDYTLASEAITEAAYSHIENPMGFPDWFNFTATYAGSGAMTYGTVTATLKFRISGSKVELMISTNGTTGGVASTAIEITPTAGHLPNCATLDSYTGSLTRDAANAAGYCYRSISDQKIRFYKTDASAFGLGASRICVGQLTHIY